MIYANDNDKAIASWLGKLPLDIDFIDTRSIKEVSADDVRKYSQCHFFAGIGGWPLALRMAEWPDDAPVWTGSCPCQPFSAAGKRAGTSDERHLWPEFRRLIAEIKPPAVFGEQVASKAGRDWLSSVRSEVEELGYDFGAADLCAASVGSPHIRQRLFWVAYSSSQRLEEREEQSAREKLSATKRSGGAVWLGDTASERPLPCALNGLHRIEKISGARYGKPERSDSDTQRMANPRYEQEGRSSMPNEEEDGGAFCNASGCSAWDRLEFIYCRDDKWRPVKSSVRPLVNGVSAILADGTTYGKKDLSRVVALHGIGNAIVPQVAAVFIKTVMEYLGLK